MNKAIYPLTPALEVTQLSVHYDKTPVLWDINLQVPQGQLVGIVGPNGAGKSTLIKAALGLVQTAAGKVKILGATFGQMRHQVAYIPQRDQAQWDFPITVRDLVVMGCYGRRGLLRRPRAIDYKEADDCLTQLELLPFADRQISQLSGGQQQRAFIARALMQKAQVYFLDEPFIGIDMSSEQTLMALLRTLRDQGRTLFVVHHDLTNVPSYFDWLIMLNMRLVASAPVLECFNSETLRQTYGHSYLLLNELIHLSQTKTQGLP